jgi:hypothetical protein
VIGVPLGMITGIVTGGTTGTVKGLLNGIVVGIDEPFSSRSMSLDGEVTDYNPYAILP